MPRIALTPAIAWSCGLDAGNASMRHGGRTAWSREDYNVAAREANRLLDSCGVP